MAETPSQVRSASEEMEELRAVLFSFTAESAASLIGRSQALVKQCNTVGAVAGELVKAAEMENGRWEEALHEAAKEPRPVSLAERIDQTRKALAGKGGPVTVARVCKDLGISQATYYRHKPVEQSTAGMMPLPI
jgi:hypothetical protein